MTPRRRRTALALAALALLAPGRALAQQRPYLTGWYAPGGLLLGASQHPSLANGLVLGLEQSLVYQVGPRASAWGGLSLDVLHDFGPSWTRLSFGPEVGYGVVGVDGGFLAVARGGKIDRGLEGRLLLTIGVLALYGRAGRVLSGAHDSFSEVGLLLKWPLSLGRTPEVLPR